MIFPGPIRSLLSMLYFLGFADVFASTDLRGESDGLLPSKAGDLPLKGRGVAGLLALKPGDDCRLACLCTLRERSFREFVMAHRTCEDW